jgi:hypothetical protein
MDAVLHVSLVVVLAIVYLVGLVLIPLGLGGTVVILIATALFDLTRGFEVVGIPLLVGFAVLVVLGEVLEAILGSVVAVRYGAGRWGVIASFVGGLVGAVVGSGVFPVVGTLVGSFLGAFLGAVGAEWAVRRRDPDALREGLRAGWGTFVGKVGAVAAKVAIGATMIVVTLVRAGG